MVAAPFAAPELIEADAAAGAADAAAGAGAEGAADAAGGGASAFANGARALSDGAGPVSTVAGLAGSGSDAAQGKWGDAAVDLAFTAGPNLGHMPTGVGDVKSFGDQFADVLGIGDRTAEADAAAATGLRDYQGWTGIGLNPAAAKSLAFDDGVVPKSLSGTDLDARSTLSAAVSQANKSAATALHLGRPAAIGFDNVVGDPSQDAIKQHVSPEPVCG
jgi:hypothetical protein